MAKPRILASNMFHSTGSTDDHSRKPYRVGMESKILDEVRVHGLIFENSLLLFSTAVMITIMVTIGYDYFTD